AARPCTDKNQPANEIGSLDGDFLSDHAADRKAERVDLGKPESLDEGDGVCARLPKARRRPARTARNTRVVEKNHLAVLSQAVGYRRIPIIHRPAEVLV